MTLPDSFGTSNQAGFVWDIGEPKGRDTLYIFASSDELTAENVRQLGQGVQHDIQRPSRGDSSTACTSYEKLRNSLFSNIDFDERVQECGISESKSFHAGRSRGEEVLEATPPKSNSDWNATSLTFWIED